MNADLLLRDQQAVDAVAVSQLQRAARGDYDALWLLLRCLKTAAVLQGAASRHGIDLDHAATPARCSQLRSLEVM
jgi:hypothetical protein